MDRNLVEPARSGDREAFAVLVHQVSDQLYAVAHRRCLAPPPAHAVEVAEASDVDAATEAIAVDIEAFERANRLVPCP